jgi:hypothetical protein
MLVSWTSRWIGRLSVGALLAFGASGCVPGGGPGGPPGYYDPGPRPAQYWGDNRWEERRWRDDRRRYDERRYHEDRRRQEADRRRRDDDRRRPEPRRDDGGGRGRAGIVIEPDRR